MTIYGYFLVCAVVWGVSYLALKGDKHDRLPAIAVIPWWLGAAGTVVLGLAIIVRILISL